MVVKKYLVRNMPEALARIKKDLGPDAVIISSYRVPGKGLIGLFIKQLEVTAAVDDRREEKYFGRLGEKPRPAPVEPGRVPDIPVGAPRLTGLPSFRNQSRPTGRALPGGQSHLPAARMVSIWRSRLSELSEDLVQLVTEDENAFGPGLGQGDEYLRCRLEQRLAGWCQRYCANQPASRVVVLTGPAGTGKTTTLVKLAARDVLDRERKVALVSLNSATRPGGSERLRGWARLLNIPFAHVGDPEELNRLMAGMGDVERFYLDTPPDPFYKSGKLLELAGFLSQFQAQVLLVLSATTRDEELCRAQAQVSRLACAGVVLTKLDEMISLGPVLNLLPRLGVPLQYLGMGHEVPEDLHPADGALLASLFLGGAVRDGHSSPGLLAAR